MLLLSVNKLEGELPLVIPIPQPSPFRFPFRCATGAQRNVVLCEQGARLRSAQWPPAEQQGPIAARANDVSLRCCAVGRDARALYR